MKTFGTYAVSIAALFIVVGFSPAIAAAADVQAGSQPSIASSENIPGSAYLVGGNITSAGIVTGDLVAAGGTILVNGPVFADVMTAGGNITLVGMVGNSVRAVGGTILIDASVKRDVLAAGGQTEISGSGIGGDVIWGGGSFIINAPVAGNLILNGAHVTINSTIKGNVQFKGGSLVLGNNAVIDGSLTYTSSQRAFLENGAVVLGQTTYTPSSGRASTGAFVVGVLSLLFLLKFAALLVCGLVGALALKKFSAKLIKNAVADPLIECVRGVAVLIVLPVFSLILLATLVGIPLGLLGLISFAAILIFGVIMAPVLVGSVASKWMFKTKDYDISWKTVLLGVILYIGIGLIPFIGWFADFIAVAITVGAMIQIKWNIVKEWR